MATKKSINSLFGAGSNTTKAVVTTNKERLTEMSSYNNSNQRLPWWKVDRLTNELRRVASRANSLSVLCLIALLASQGACSAVFDDSHSSDAALIRNFELHEQDFNKLIEMAKVDSHVVRIAYDFTWVDTNYHWPRPESELGFTKERWDEYKRMFSRLGLKKGLSWTSDGAIVLIASTRGLSTDGSAKGYAFSQKNLSPTFDSLDNMHQEIMDGKVKPGLPVYRKIKDGWYLYYEGD